MLWHENHCHFRLQGSVWQIRSPFFWLRTSKRPAIEDHWRLQENKIENLDWVRKSEELGEDKNYVEKKLRTQLLQLLAPKHDFPQILHVEWNVREIIFVVFIVIAWNIGKSIEQSITFLKFLIFFICDFSIRVPLHHHRLFPWRATVCITRSPLSLLIFELLV